FAKVRSEHPIRRAKSGRDRFSVSRSSRIGLASALTRQPLLCLVTRDARIDRLVCLGEAGVAIVRVHFERRIRFLQAFIPELVHEPTVTLNHRVRMCGYADRRRLNLKWR